jgi:V/A-type H+-transporting ATPase subunit F
MKYRIIGERELVLGFSLVGIDGTVASTRDEALEAFRVATSQGASLSSLAANAPRDEERALVLIMTEEVAAMLEDEVREWQMTGEFPLIVEIPGLHGHLPGRKTLTESIREAIGIRV